MAKRLNPVELMIFLGVTAGFIFSAYQVFAQKPLSNTAMLTPMSSNPISESGRQPASSSSLLGSVDFSCSPQQEAAVKASKIRIAGPICGMTAGARIISTSVINSANQFHATVFTDLNSGKFSTDYIPLNSEKNPIQIEFKFGNGKKTSHALILQKE